MGQFGVGRKGEGTTKDKEEKLRKFQDGLSHSQASYAGGLGH
jgi:hypothetical protein